MSMLARFAATGGGGDPYWNNVSLLLVGNGANNTTTNIVDSSINNRAFTVNGSTVISTGQSKYGSGSVYFNGSTETYVSIASFPASTGLGSGDWTIEFWFNPASIPSVPLDIFGFYDSAAAGIIIGQIAGGNVRVYCEGAQISGGTITLGTWVYITAVRNSGTITLFLDGFSKSSVAASAPGSNNFSIGRAGGYNGNYAYGYIYDFRITKGVARYTSNFTPPTAPLPTYGP